MWKRIVRHNAPLDKCYERLMAANDQPYFVLTSANGEAIGRSELYPGVKAAMENAIASVKRNAQGRSSQGYERRIIRV